MTQRRKFLALASCLVVAASAAAVSGIGWPAVGPRSPYVSTIASKARRPAPTTTSDADRPPVEPADPKLLQVLLPDNVGALKRGDIEAGERSIGEMHSSIAQAPFGEDPSPTASHANVKIVDYVAMPGLIESVAPWQSLDIANQNEADYSRTTKIGPYKAFETYTTQTHSGSLNVVVSKRFVVSIEIVSLPPETMRETALAMKLDDLAAIGK